MKQQSSEKIASCHCKEFSPEAQGSAAICADCEEDFVFSFLQSDWNSNDVAGYEVGRLRVAAAFLLIGKYLERAVRAYAEFCGTSLF